jgi:hypothetical protein
MISGTSRRGFILLLTLSLLASYYVHQAIGVRDILPAYLFNGIITLASFLLLFHLLKKGSEVVGYVFMGVSGVKFLLFFIFFQPFGLSPELKREIVIDFFIPYGICMVYEVYFLAKSLK